MFTRKVTDDDHFMSLSASAQALYLHLTMSADDDGFNNQVSISMFKAHASVSDLEALLEKRYIYQFENGVIVIKHWRMANALRKDRYNETVFQKELAQLKLEDSGVYERPGANWLPNGCQAVATDKSRVDKSRLDKSDISPAPTPNREKHKRGEYGNVLLTDEEYGKLKVELPDADDYVERLSAYIASTGKKYKSHYATIRNWAARDKQDPKQSHAGKAQEDKRAPSYDIGMFEAAAINVPDYQSKNKKEV